MALRVYCEIVLVIDYERSNKVKNSVFSNFVDK